MTLHRTWENKLAETVSKNNYEMNECYHGESSEACGVQYCAWSAAGVIFAANGASLFFKP